MTFNSECLPDPCTPLRGCCELGGKGLPEFVGKTEAHHYCTTEHRSGPSEGSPVIYRLCSLILTVYPMIESRDKSPSIPLQMFELGSNH